MTPSATRKSDKDGDTSANELANSGLADSFVDHLTGVGGQIGLAFRSNKDLS
jgi:hypothetical protein